VPKPAGPATIVLTGLATSVPFTTVASGPERTPTDNHGGRNRRRLSSGQVMILPDLALQAGVVSSSPIISPTTAQVSIHEQRGGLDPLASRAWFVPLACP
jgi:hypothetical protein